jgi:hypothetical protein
MHCSIPLSSWLEADLENLLILGNDVLNMTRGPFVFMPFGALSDVFQASSVLNLGQRQAPLEREFDKCDGFFCISYPANPTMEPLDIYITYLITWE